MVFGGGTFELNVDNSFLKTRYNPAYVSYPDSTTVVVASGATTRIIGEPITTTSVRSYQLKFTSYGTNMCFGLISAANVNTIALEGGDFSAHWGVCVGATYPTGQLATVCPCEKCANNGCDTCDGPNPEHCSLCIPGYFMPGCQACNYACAACFGLASNQCSACKTGFFLQPSSTTCADECPSGYWKDTTNHICAPCNAACTTCLDETNTQCSTCNTNYYLQPPPAGTTCDSTCPNGYWRDDTINKCQPCHNSCSICTGPGNDQCSACNSGFFRQPAPSDTTCLNSCPVGYWKDTDTNVCTSCQGWCSVCIGPTNINCTACNPGYYLLPAPSTTCSNYCPSGSWKDDANHVCVGCYTSCSQCTGSLDTQCSACKSGYFLQPSVASCVNTCPTGYFGNSASNTCEACDSACLVCTGSLNTQCSACKSGYFLQPSSTICLNSCPDEYWKDNANHVCSSCHTSCLQCTGSLNTQCTACKSGYFLQPSSTICLNSCPATGHWKDTTNHICASCNAACSVCTGANNDQCSECNVGYFLQPSPATTTCFDSCPVGYWGDPTSNTCTECDIACAICTGSAHTQCSACSTGYFLQPNSTICLNSCPDGTWPNSINNMCMDCDIACSTCTNAAHTQCSACSTGYFLQPNSTICLNSCPDGTWSNSASNTCIECDISCAECTGPGNTQCSVCEPGYFLQPDSTICLSTCPDYYYANTSLNTCESILNYLLDSL